MDFYTGHFFWYSEFWYIHVQYGSPMHRFPVGHFVKYAEFMCMERPVNETTTIYYKTYFEVIYANFWSNPCWFKRAYTKIWIKLRQNLLHNIRFRLRLFRTTDVHCTGSYNISSTKLHTQSWSETTYFWQMLFGIVVYLLL